MNSKEDQINSESTNLENEISIEKQKDANYINEQTNSEVTNLDNESFIEEQKDTNYTSEQNEDNKLDEKSIESKDEYKFGWSSYSEITNGRFAMIGFLAIILIELFSQQSFLKWAGIL